MGRPRVVVLLQYNRPSQRATMKTHLRATTRHLAELSASERYDLSEHHRNTAELRCTYRCSQKANSAVTWGLRTTIRAV